MPDGRRARRNRSEFYRELAGLTGEFLNALADELAEWAMALEGASSSYKPEP